MVYQSYIDDIKPKALERGYTSDEFQYFYAEMKSARLRNRNRGESEEHLIWRIDRDVWNFYCVFLILF